MKVLERAAQAAEAVMGRVAWLMSAAAALSVAGIVAILVFSSLQRYMLAQPIPETEELAAFLFVTVAFLSVPEGFTSNRQIRVLLVWRKLPDRAQGWAMVLGHLLTIAVLVMLIVQLRDFAAMSYEFQSRSYVSDFIMWPWMAVIPVSLGVLCLAVAARALVDLHAVLSGAPVREARAATELEPE
ncbi:MAG: TRAP transporter small permease [Hyphomicrobiales bacterium]|nr:TRAP transporter small permease [Hyphomicrobiales bacterium]MCP5373334.1 TRAP transporter small permease [Hyphomicrobiales bacterium]